MIESEWVTMIPHANQKSYVFSKSDTIRQFKHANFMNAFGNESTEPMNMSKAEGFGSEKQLTAKKKNPILKHKPAKAIDL